jgi:predicted CxxxxCH...CXXCH cytochrome family protein
MRSSIPVTLIALATLGLASCDGRPAVEGGSSGDPTTGSHTVHLTGPVASTISCGECHNGQFAVTLEGSLARANGAVPSFNGGALTCSNVYCHAGGPRLPLGGGTVPVPVWNPPSVVGCGACHSMPGAGAAAWHPAVAAGVQCGLCHPGYTNTTVNRPIHVNGERNLTQPTMLTNCAACHGDASRVLPDGTPELVKAAPPVDRNGSSSTASAGVGAHQKHLLPGLTAIAAPVQCAACHVVPTDLVHVGPTALSAATVDFGGLAAANGARPVLVPPAPGSTSYTCSNVYCHGGGPGLLLGGGTIPSPSWNPPSAVTCGACHALPGGSVDTSAWHPAVAVGADCGLCHTGYTRETVNVAVHVNGLPDVRAPDLVTSCTACHGDANRVVPAGSPPELLAAPPVDRHGSSDTKQVGVGAHQAHLLPGAEAIAKPIACTQCHVVPVNLLHVGPGPASEASLEWGTLASANGAVPAFNSANATCTNYCHGQTLPEGGGSITQPRWNKVDGTQAACGTCHGSPPQDVSHTLHAGSLGPALPCSSCHPAGYTWRAVGPDVVPIHVNGVNDVTILDWKPDQVGPTGWRGTSVVGCHGGLRYWTPGSLPSCQ